ncbi:MAG: hypothetical protein P8Y07_04860, partial [Gemmatimonadales bacterium]
MSRRNSLLLPLALALTAFVMAAPVSVQARRAPGPATRAEAAPQDSAGAQDSAAVQPLDTTVAVSLAIPAADIPRRAEETSVELREMLGRLQPEQDLNAQASAVQDLLFRLGRKRTEFERLDVDELSARALEDLRQEWLAFQFQLNRWQGPLVAQGEGIVAERLRLREIKEIWSETLRSASSTEMPPALVQRAESVLQAQEAVLGRELVHFEALELSSLSSQPEEQILDGACLGI